LDLVWRFLSQTPDKSTNQIGVPQWLGSENMSMCKVKIIVGNAMVLPPNDETWFFDPNFGQYKFSDKQSFMTWFEHTLFCLNCGIHGATATAEIQHYH